MAPAQVNPGQRRVLVVDDEAKIAQVLRLYLERDGYQVATAADGPAALALFRQWRPDLIVLDVMLPGLDGLEVCRSVRRDSEVPIILLTARSEEVDKLVGLELGADDYVTKPFSPREVVARVRAVLRRAGGAGSAAAPAALTFEHLTLDPGRHELRCHDRPVDLTATEFRLLSVLAQQPGRVFTRLQLLDLAQGEAYESYERTVDVHVKNIRQKLGRCPEPASVGIVTVHGVGYKLAEVGGA